MSICCLIGLPCSEDDIPGKIKYGKIKEKIIEYENIDFMWKNTTEVVFLNNIIEARLSYNQHDFADHLYYWDNLHPFSTVELRSLKTMHIEIQDELDRQAAERRLELFKKEKARIKKEKIAAKKKLMEELGLKGKIEIDEDQVEEEARAKFNMEDLTASQTSST